MTTSKGDVYTLSHRNTYDSNTRRWHSHEVRYSGIVNGDVGLMIRYPTLSSGSSISVNIEVTEDKNSMGFSLELTKSYNADYDGDECVVCVIRTPEGVMECKSILHSNVRPFKNSILKARLCNPTKNQETHGFLWETGFSYREGLKINLNDFHKAAGIDDAKIKAFTKSFKEVPGDEERFHRLAKYNTKSISKSGVQSNSGYLGRIGRVGASNFMTDLEGNVRLVSDNVSVLVNAFGPAGAYPSYGIPSIRAISKLTRKITQSTLTKKSAKDDMNIAEGVDLISELISGCKRVDSYCTLTCSNLVTIYLLIPIFMVLLFP